MEKMEYLIKMDDLGRMILPKKLRKGMKSKEFLAHESKDGIVLRPIPTWDEIFGSSPKLDMKAFARQHKEDWL